MLEALKKEKPRRIMGIDCSSNSLAYSVFDDGALVRYGVVNFGKGDVWRRMGRANDITNALSEALVGDVDAIYFESAAYVQNKQTVILLAYALGAAMAPFIKKGTLVEPIPAVVWQRAIGNNPWTKEQKEDLRKLHPERTKVWLANEMRKQRKQKTIEWVSEKFRVKTSNDDLADAIALGYVGSLRSGSAKARQESVDS